MATSPGYRYRRSARARESASFRSQHAPHRGARLGPARRGLRADGPGGHAALRWTGPQRTRGVGRIMHSSSCATIDNLASSDRARRRRPLPPSAPSLWCQVLAVLRGESAIRSSPHAVLAQPMLLSCIQGAWALIRGVPARACAPSLFTARERSSPTAASCRSAHLRHTPGFSRPTRIYHLPRSACLLSARSKGTELSSGNISSGDSPVRRPPLPFEPTQQPGAKPPHPP